MKPMIEFTPNPLPYDVMALIHSANAIKKGIIPEEYDEPYFISLSLANVLNLVLKDYGISPDYEGEINPTVREKLWNIIWDYSTTSD